MGPEGNVIKLSLAHRERWRAKRDGEGVYHINITLSPACVGSSPKRRAFFY